MKTYMIVTNDSFELPVSEEITGAEAAKRLGIPVAYLHQCLCKGFAKKAKYKAVVVADRQYTGLTDKNGKKIWENDVVRYSWTDGQGEAETDVVAVEYDYYGFTPYVWDYDCDGCCLYCEIIEIEVIGNIFDNPELLREE